MKTDQIFLGKLLRLSIFFCICGISLEAQVTQEAASHSMAGGTAQSSSYSMQAVIGQSSPPGSATGDQFVIQAGFLSLFQDTLGDVQPPAAPMNLSVNPSNWTNVNSFSISWDFPEPAENLEGIWYKIGLPPVHDEDGIFTATETGLLSEINVDSTGTHNLYLWLQDKNGNKSHENRAECVLYFDNISPQIEHTRIVTVPVNTIINIGANAIDMHSQLKEQWLYYRKTGDAGSIDSAQFSSAMASIPEGVNTQRGTEYAIMAKDFAGNRSTIPAEGFFPINVQLSGEGGIHTNESGQPVTVHSGSSVNDYRIFSVPFELDNKMVSSVFEDDLGQPDDSRWLLFDINHGNLRDYSTIKNLNIVKPGKGFLLISNIDNITIDSGPGQSPDLNTYSDIELESGWNLIGNPFDFDIPLNNLSVNGEVPEAWYLISSGWQSNPAYLKKWEGVAIYTNNAAPLHIIPAEGAEFNYSVADQFNDENWGIRILAKGVDNTDRDNFIGVYDPESETNKRTIYHEAPRLANAISIHIRADHGLSKKEDLSADQKLSTLLKPANEDGYNWDLEIESDESGEEVLIEFERLGEFPDGLSAYLIDTDLKTAYNMDEINWMHKCKSNINGRHFRLVIGNQEYAEIHSNGISLVAEKFTLRQNFPNPFNPYTTIIFTLPETNEVTLDIFNITGQKVRTVINNTVMDKGYHSIDWDGKNNTGKKVATGVYLYRLRAGKFTSVRKAILSR